MVVVVTCDATNEHHCLVLHDLVTQPFWLGLCIWQCPDQMW